jgi:DUF2971 family protein
MKQLSGKLAGYAVENGRGHREASNAEDGRKGWPRGCQENDPRPAHGAREEGRRCISEGADEEGEGEEGRTMNDQVKVGAESTAPLGRAEEWKSILSESKLFDQLFEARFPGTLWHYTTATGIQGIVTSGSLHATDVRFLNDPLEVAYGARLANVIMQKMASHPFISLFQKHFETDVIEGGHFPKYTLPRGICSFCVDGDLLSQWRGYGHFGTGYSIGVDVEPLVLHCASDSVLSPVFYDPSEQVELLKELLTKACGIYDQFGEDSLAPLAGVLFNQILRHALTFKREGFAAEGEWRLIVSPNVVDKNTSLPLPNSNCGFRTSGGLVVPYFTVPIRDQNEHLPIGGVVLGPGLDYALAEYAIRSLFSVHNSGRLPAIRPSSLTLRS